jgi:uncharacterized protein
MNHMDGAEKIHPRYVVDEKGRKPEIVEKLKSALRDTEGIAFAYLFGSFLNQETFRDIDLGIYLEESSYRRRTEIVEELYGNLEGVFEPVDIRILNEAPPSFLYHVLRGELLELCDEELHARIFETTVRTYLDVKPILVQATKEAFG